MFRGALGGIMAADSSLSRSVTHIIEQLRDGDDAAVARLWDRYFERLVRLARRRLQNHPRRIDDEEDAAVSVMHCLCNGVDREKFPDFKKPG